MRLTLAAALAAAVFAAPAAAQETDGWDMNRDPDGRTVLAYTAYENGLSLAFRCTEGSFAAVVAGLPSQIRPRRTLSVSLRGEPAFNTNWTSTTNVSVAVADYPALLAREFRQGGELKLTVPGGASDGRNLSYVVPLPSSGAAIDQVLTECGRPLVDARDAELEPLGSSNLTLGLNWAREPRPDFPATSRYAEGFAVTSCLTQPDGKLEACVTESEHPADGGFGRAAMRGAEQARVQISDDQDAPVPRRLVVFYTRFIGG